MSQVPHDPPPGSDPPASNIQEVRLQQVGARVPERIGRGAFCTGVIVMRGASEFVLDFAVRLSRPYQVAARVVVPFGVMPRFIEALGLNLQKYTERFGPPPALPAPPQPQRRPTFQEIYDDLKLPEDQFSGSYCNAVMIYHTPAEFCLDFVTNFFPQSAVSARVYMSAAQAPGLLRSLTESYEFYRRQADQGPPPPPPQPPAAE